MPRTRRPLIGRWLGYFSIDISITISLSRKYETAISIPDDWYEEVEIFFKKAPAFPATARVFAMAVRSLWKRKRIKNSLALNEAYSEEETVEERSCEKKARDTMPKGLKENRGD